MDEHTSPSPDELISQLEQGIKYYDGNGEKKCKRKAKKLIRDAIKKGVDRIIEQKGDADIMYELGRCYHDGKGVYKNKEKTVHWFRLAAEKGHIDAMYDLALCCRDGYGLKQDVVRAVSWFRTAAEKGQTNAMVELGKCYRDRIGMDRDEEKALYWFRKASESGNINAMYELGQCYYHGAGVEKDRQQAKQWFRKAAEKGHEEAKDQLSIVAMIRKAIVAGISVVMLPFIIIAKISKCIAHHPEVPRAGYVISHWNKDENEHRRRSLQGYRWSSSTPKPRLPVRSAEEIDKLLRPPSLTIPESRPAGHILLKPPSETTAGPALDPTLTDEYRQAMGNPEAYNRFFCRPPETTTRPDPEPTPATKPTETAPPKAETTSPKVDSVNPGDAGKEVKQTVDTKTRDEMILRAVIASRVIHDRLKHRTQGKDTPPSSPENNQSDSSLLNTVATNIEAIRKLAEQGNTEAQVVLGVCYFLGNGIEKDEEQAKQWLREASDGGDPDAKELLQQIEQK